MFPDFPTYIYQNEYILYIWPAESGSKSFLHSNITAAFSETLSGPFLKDQQFNSS